MGRDLNKVQLTGHLGGDPEMRYTPQGAAVTNFRVASGRAWKDSSGTKHEETEWFRIVAWDKLGEICNQYLTKGTKVYVEGRLQTRKYTDRDGVERYISEVVASDMIILSSRRDGVADEVADDEVFPDEPASPPPARSAASGRPVADARTSRPNAPRNQPQPIESDDDIPF